jgi:hypothetical protein
VLTQSLVDVSKRQERTNDLFRADAEQHHSRARRSVRVPVAQNYTLGVSGRAGSVVDGNSVIRSGCVDGERLLLAQRLDVADVLDRHTHLAGQRIQNITL